MELGGPVWHVSVKSRRPMPEWELRRIARRQIDGCGDARLGEWVEAGRVLHLRRRLSAAEVEHVGPVVDIRRTPEAAARAARLGPLLSLIPEDIVRDEVGHP